jgi:hypothetical protein
MPREKLADVLADTLKNSSSTVRAAKTGEYGWKRGAVTRVRKGYKFAAFSGGIFWGDFKVCQTGPATLAAKSSRSSQCPHSAASSRLGSPVPAPDHGLGPRSI